MKASYENKRKAIKQRLRGAEKQIEQDFVAEFTRGKAEMYQQHQQLMSMSRSLAQDISSEENVDIVQLMTHLEEVASLSSCVLETVPMLLKLAQRAVEPQMEVLQQDEEITKLSEEVEKKAQEEARVKTILEMVIEKNKHPTMNVEDLLRGALKHLRVQLPDMVQKARLPVTKETPVSSLPKSAATLSRLAELAKRMGQEAGVETEVREKEAENLKEKRNQEH